MWKEPLTEKTWEQGCVIFGEQKNLREIFWMNKDYFCGIYTLVAAREKSAELPVALEEKP